MINGLPEFMGNRERHAIGYRIQCISLNSSYVYFTIHQYQVPGGGGGGGGGEGSRSLSREVKQNNKRKLISPMLSLTIHYPLFSHRAYAARRPNTCSWHNTCTEL